MLLINRHLDTVLLCAIYAVCNKVAKIDLKFRTIIAVYVSRWEQNSLIVTRKVFSKSGNEYVNIIDFYNNIFIPSIKLFTMNKIKPVFNQLKKHSKFDPSIRSGLQSPALCASGRSYLLSPQRYGSDFARS